MKVFVASLLAVTALSSCDDRKNPSNVTDAGVAAAASVKPASSSETLALAASTTPVPLSPCLSQQALNDIGGQITQNPFQFGERAGLASVPGGGDVRAMGKKWLALVAANPEAQFSWDKTIEKFDKGRNIYNCEGDIIIASPVKVRSEEARRIVSEIQIDGAGKVLGGTTTVKTSDGEKSTFEWAVADRGTLTNPLLDAVNRCRKVSGRHCLYVQRPVTQTVGRIENAALKALELRAHVEYSVTETLQGGAQTKLTDGEAYPDSSFFQSLEGTVKPAGRVQGDRCFMMAAVTNEVTDEVACDAKATASPALKPAADGASADGKAIQQPVWLKKPTSVDFERHFPAKASDEGKAGRVVLNCTVAVNGGLTCQVVSETPEGYGFGVAALRVSRSFQMAPMTVDGRPTSGGKVMVPIGFNVN